MHSQIRLQWQHAGLLFDTLWRSPMIMMMVICPFLRPPLKVCGPAQPKDLREIVSDFPTLGEVEKHSDQIFLRFQRKRQSKAFQSQLTVTVFLFACLTPMSTLQLKNFSIVRLTTQPWSHALSGCVIPRFYSHTARYDNGDDDSRQIVGWLSCFLFSPVSLVGLK